MYLHWSSSPQQSHGEVAEAPLRVCRATGVGLVDGDLLEGEVHQVDEAHAELREQVEELAHEVPTCPRGSSLIPATSDAEEGELGDPA